MWSVRFFFFIKINRVRRCYREPFLLKKEKEKDFHFFFAYYYYSTIRGPFTTFCDFVPSPSIKNRHDDSSTDRLIPIIIMRSTGSKSISVRPTRCCHNGLSFLNVKFVKIGVRRQKFVFFFDNRPPESDWFWYLSVCQSAGKDIARVIFI